MAKMKTRTQASDSVELECSVFVYGMYIASLVANVDGFTGNEKVQGEAQTARLSDMHKVSEQKHTLT